MVSWAQDGLVSGYSPVDEEWRGNNFFLNSGVLADINGVTRLQRYLPPQQIDPYNNIRAEVRLTFTSGDFTGGNMVGAFMYVARESDIGGVPTNKQQIIDKAFGIYGPSPGYNYNNTVYSDGQFRNSPGTYDFFINGPKPSAGTQISPNTKLWVLVTPITFDNVAVYPLVSSARAISVWTNRTPGKPTISSPPSGTSVTPGATITLTYAPNDPDALTPNGSDGINADLAGVQIQYAPVPSLENPNPEWRDLPRVNEDGNENAESWYIRASSYGLAGDLSLITARGATITCGTDNVEPGNSVLPGGSWQIRVRTFDFGHPYPNLYRAAGFNDSALLFPDNMPPSLVSPWSDPVTITVTAQVAPPKLIYPIADIAEGEGSTVRLQWRHQSTFITPRGQTARQVQIKRTVDSTWATVAAGDSTQEFFDLPPEYIAPPAIPDHEYLTDLSFESGSLNGWSAYDPFLLCDGTQSASNVNVPANAHTGNRYLNLVYAGSGWPGLQKIVDLDPDHDEFQFKAWVHPVNAATTTTVALIWLDAAGDPLPNEFQIIAWEATKSGGGAWPEPWMLGDTGVLPRPPGAEKAQLIHWSADLDGFVMTGFGGGRMDDVSFVGKSTTNTDSFTMEATNRYEWRARTRDSDGVWSSFSPAARFWVVPVPDSGSLRPIPAETIDGATLGRGTHRVEIYRRGGTMRVGELRGITKVEWNRRRDDLSDSRVVIEDWDIDCGNLLSKLQPWAYEVVIHRDNGFTSERVWEGPITLLTYETNKVIIQAKDVMGYAYRRIIKQRMSDTGTGTTVVDRARRILQNAFAPDDPNVLAYLQVIANESDAMQYRSTPAYSRTAFEEVDDMAANAGLDYTVVGRSILLWGTKNRIGTLPEFRDSDFGEAPIVSVYGMSMANRYAVSDGNGVWGEATRLDVSGNDPVYGLVEMLSSTWATDSTDEFGTYTQEGLQTTIESFEGFAERSIADRYPPPVVVRIPDNTSLQPDAAVSIQHLVPGVAVPLRSNSTLREVVQTQKLDSVTVVEEGGRETVQVTMSSFSREDTGTEEVEV